MDRVSSISSKDDSEKYARVESEEEKEDDDMDVDRKDEEVEEKIESDEHKDEHENDEEDHKNEVKKQSAGEDEENNEIKVQQLDVAEIEETDQDKEEGKSAPNEIQDVEMAVNKPEEIKEQAVNHEDENEPLKMEDIIQVKTEGDKNANQQQKENGQAQPEEVKNDYGAEEDDASLDKYLELNPMEAVDSEVKFEDKKEGTLNNLFQNDNDECKSVNSTTLSNDEGRGYDLLETLFKFVKNDEEINPVLAGYFAKLVNALIKAHPLEVTNFSPNLQFFEYVYNDANALYNMVNHLYAKPIGELVIQILCADERYVLKAATITVWF